MRVCFVCGNIYPLLAKRTDIPIVGGAEVQQYLIGQELARQGVEVSYVTEDFGQGTETVHDNFRVLAYKYSRNKVVQGLTIWRALEQANADLYYVRGVPKFLAILLMYCAIRRRQFVIGMSSNHTVYPKTGLSLPHYLTYRLALKVCALIIAQTNFQAMKLAQNYGIGEAVVIRNGTEISSLQSTSVKEKKEILWIGSIHPYKGVEKVFELAQALPNQRFVIVGGPSRGMEGYYEQIRVKAQHFSNIKWRGLIPNEHINEELSGALALINTTVTYYGVPNLEGFPNVYLEAWRNGVPTLTIDNDPDEIICQNGLGYHCQTIQQMANDLEQLAHNPILREQIGKAAREYCEREHEIKKIARQYVSVFTRIVDRG